MEPKVFHSIAGYFSSLPEYLPVLLMGIDMS